MVIQNQFSTPSINSVWSFWDGTNNDMAGFFVAFGDWGLGKTRLGYELIAEVTGRGRHGSSIPTNTLSTLPSLGPQARPGASVADGVLPLYIRYSTVCDDDLDAPTWVPRLAVEAMRHLLDMIRPLAGRVICTQTSRPRCMQRGDASASTWCVMPPGVMTIGSQC